MVTHQKFKNILKVSVFLSVALLSTVSEARVGVNVGIGMGGPVYAAPPPAYYPAPYPPAPYPYPPAPVVTWVPSHLENGYMVPGHYVQYPAYAPPPPAAGYVWIGGGWDHYHHWHDGHWGRRH